MTDDLPGWLSNFCCQGDVHFFIGNEPVCTCGATGVYEDMSGNGRHLVRCTSQAATPPGAFYGYHPPQYTPAPAEVKIEPRIKVLAKLAGATHISDDGTRAYRSQMGRVEWIDLESSWPSWWPVDDGIMPSGVIQLL